MQFADIKNDIAFRKIFGNENKKIILISFLNAILNLRGTRRIEHVEIVDPYQLPIIKNLKASIIDVKARDQMGRTFIIEMQVSEPDGLDKRLLYYASKDYAHQIERGEEYEQLRPVIFIGIFDFKFTKGPKYLSNHSVCDVDDGERVIKDMDFYFIELPKFKKQLADLLTITDKWIFFIKEAENLEIIPDNLEDEGLKAAWSDAQKFTWTKAERSAYDYASMREGDAKGVIKLAVRRAVEKAVEKAEADGEARGEARGEASAKKQIAATLKMQGIEPSVIMAATGLSIDEIEML